MANGAPAAQPKLPPAIAERLQQEQAREHAARALAAQLQATPTDPTETRRFLLCLPAVAHEGDTALILVALPSGERLEIPLSDAGKRRLIDGLSEGPDTPAESNGGAVELG